MSVTVSTEQARLTLVIPTMNRAPFLFKLLKYHAKMRCPYLLVIGDSSDPTEFKRNQQVIALFKGRLRVHTVRHTPGATPMASTIELLERVATPYTAWCGDDDFLVPRHLKRCVDFLDAHPNYHLACGDSTEVFVDSLPDHRFTVVRITGGASKGSHSPSPSQRLLSWARPNIGKNTLSVQRTASIRYSWSKASEAGLDSKVTAPLHELCVNAISILQGKEMRLPGLYHVMLRHGQKTACSGPLDYFERATRWDWSREVVNVVECLAREIRKREEIEYTKARRIAEAVFLQWLVPFLSRNRDRKLREQGLLLTRKTVRERFSALAGMRSAWFYPKDFLPIYSILTEPEFLPWEEQPDLRKDSLESVLSIRT